MSARLGALFREARNGTRLSHMEVLMYAVYQHALERGGVFPDCVPGPNQPAVSLDQCDEELEVYIKNPGLWRDPNAPEQKYMIEHLLEEGMERIRIFSTDPEAKNVEVVR